jgi:ribosome-interacting GTPase 1
VPANLTPQYFEAEKRLRDAREPEDKIAALQEMLAVMPRHKGTDKLHAALRSKIAKLTQEAERKTATARRAGFYIRREGAGQILLTGPANSGKSQLLAVLTGAQPEVALYPYTTQTPLPGMMTFEDVQIQLVDTPPLGHKNVRLLLQNILRVADIVALVVDASADPVAEVEWTLAQLVESRIVPIGSPTPEGQAGSFYGKKMLIIANKLDLPGASDNVPLLRNRYEPAMRVIAVSATMGDGLARLPGELFAALDVIRVYTKAPGEKMDLSEPVILPTGSTVGDAAEEVHKDIRKGLKHAVVWGSGKFEAQTVSKTHVLRDRDIIELHA